MSNIGRYTFQPDLIPLADGRSTFAAAMPVFTLSFWERA